MALQQPKPLDFVNFFTGAASSSSRGSAELKIRAVEESDLDELSVLCTDSFFGTHTLTDGPVIFLQRLLILLRVRKQLARRISFEDDDRECRLVIAEDVRSGQISGCLDLAVHLYDRDQQRFFLTVDEMPQRNALERNRWAWRPRSGPNKPPTRRLAAVARTAQQPTQSARLQAQGVLIHPGASPGPPSSLTVPPASEWPSTRAFVPTGDSPRVSPPDRTSRRSRCATRTGGAAWRGGSWPRPRWSRSSGGTASSSSR